MNEGKYPIGIQSFRELRNRNCIYVDKTADIYRLANTNKYYFLSRPRRFGKSLLVSTLETYFSGDKGYFGGLAIEGLQPGDWPVHPVLHFDFSKGEYTRRGGLESVLDYMLSSYEEVYGTRREARAPGERFAELIERAYARTGRQAVVLIDEYDLPIVNSIGDKAMGEENRAILKGFYGVMKSMDAKLRFVLLTGVGKLGQLSVFSGLNNILDISLLPQYSTLCGISEEELHRYFSEGIRELADYNGWSEEEAYRRLKSRYDGYHFAEDLRDIYNPFSLLNCLATRKVAGFWFQTGTPSHLLTVLSEARTDLARLGHTVIDADALVAADVIQYKPVPFMFYTGYLTIKAYDGDFGEYTLGYPNTEVEQGFMKCLLPCITGTDDGEANNFVKNSVRMIRSGRIEEFLVSMKAFYAGIPYDMQARNEYFYQNVMYCVTTMLGFYVQAEYHTSGGRIDMVLGTDTTVYVMEFKLDKSAQTAMEQIEDRGYALPFSLSGRRVVKVAADFSSRTRTLDSWIIREA